MQKPFLASKFNKAPQHVGLIPCWTENKLHSITHYTLQSDFSFQKPYDSGSLVSIQDPSTPAGWPFLELFRRDYSGAEIDLWPNICAKQ